jgi:hypothetical protein
MTDKKRTVTSEFAAVTRAANKLDKGIEDIKIPAKEIRYHDGVIDLSNDKGIPFSNWAFESLCDLLDMPPKYLLRCAAKERPDIVEANVNGWLERDERTFLVRRYEGDIEGILSDRYIPFNHSEAVKTVKEGLKGNDIKVHKWSCDPLGMHIRIGMESVKRELRVGDPFSGALDIVNSEVGKYTFAIYPKLLRLACTNGMVVVDQTVQFNVFRHVHLKPMPVEEFGEYLPAVISEMPSRLEATEDMYSRSHDMYLDDQILWDLFMRMRNGVNRKFADEVFTYWMTEERFSVSLEVRVKEDEFSQGGNKPSLYGFWNAATNVVQDAESLDVEKRMAAEEYVAFVMFQVFRRLAA